MAREHSHVRKRRRGCLSGCLTKIVLLLGLCALLFVASCSLGVVKNDPETGAPYLSLESVGLGSIDFGDFDPQAFLTTSLPEFSLPALDWPYAVERSGLTVKTLRAGEGEAVLVCSDGYTMLLGGGDGSGAMLCAQLLLSGVNRLDAAVGMQSADAQLGGMALAVKLMKPAYLLCPGTQVKTGAYNDLMRAAQGVKGLTFLEPKQGLAFMLGRAKVSVIGPRNTQHTNERDDGLSIRIDYGNNAVLVMGGVTMTGEREMMLSAPVKADVLIASSGGSSEGTATEFAEAVSPKVAILTGKAPANAVQVRFERVGADVYRMDEHGVVTVFSDGENVRVAP